MKSAILGGLVLGTILLQFPDAGAVGLSMNVVGSGGARVSDANYEHSCTLGQAAVESIIYAVPVPSQVVIRLFEVTGRTVQTLVDGHVEPGYHRATLGTRGLTAGVYFCRMDAKGFSTSKKPVLLRETRGRVA
ncbi:hypothetical protein ACFL6M_03840 [Candidatus Eisenbacteria bacterium]|uniref:Secretion system C-terminal sorting domain-containing protein n=1 Tax=Eiseniibacteriota bacterium TaxID=2212470 RepID=A0ABV6YK37_UNCEI